MTRRLTIGACLLWAAACSRSGLPSGAAAGGADSVQGEDSNKPERTPPSGSGNATGTASSGGAGQSGSPARGDDPSQPEMCLRPGANPIIGDLDMLFIVDNSGSMLEEQAALRREFPKLVRALTTGDRDGDGLSDGPFVRSLHLGVVSTDMGLVGIQGIEKCNGLGDDGILQNTPSAERGLDCQASYPPFLTFRAGSSDAEAFARDFACIATLGTDGCGFEQQLEAGLKALWPSIDVDPATGRLLAMNRIRFLGDATGLGTTSHGDLENTGFLRGDTEQGPSLLVILLVTDEEDCSSADTSHFTPAHFLDPNSQLAMQDLNLRCFYNPQNLWPLDRYLSGFRALRPGNEQLVMFAAIAGVPPDLVAQAAASPELYDKILSDPRMQERVDPARPPEQGANLMPSCDTSIGKAYPPRRIVELTRRFGRNGIVQSICQQDFGPALNVILERVGERIENPCAE